VTDNTTPNPPPTPPKRPTRHWIRHFFLRPLGVLLLGVGILGIIGWETLAVYYASLSGAPPRHVLATLVALGSLASLLAIRPKRYKFGVFALIFAITLAWYFSIQPSNNRDWAMDCSVLPWVEIQGNRMRVHNLRDFEYRTETDFTPIWRDRSYDLDRIQSVDFSLCFWGSKAIAHGIVSFGFSDGQYLAFSIETRREKTETYSAVQGFFRQYELIYIMADERDVIRLRTNYRNPKEDLYLYHTRCTPTEAREVLLSYIESVNSLRQNPEWYNALTTNCVTSIVPHARAGRPTAHYTWQTMLAGYAARQAYDNGNLDDSMPFEQLEARSHINPAAQAADNAPDFSQRIRAGLPVPRHD
jgi:Domain of unknown function (DUF4105)